LDQRSIDRPSNAPMLSIMEKIACFLSCVVNSYEIKPVPLEILSVSVQSISKIGFLINYFKKYPLLGTKAKDFEY